MDIDRLVRAAGEGPSTFPADANRKPPTPNPVSRAHLAGHHHHLDIQRDALLPLNDRVLRPSRPRAMLFSLARVMPLGLWAY